jgi:hypothetical protein
MHINVTQQEKIKMKLSNAKIHKPLNVVATFVLGLPSKLGRDNRNKL